MDDQELKALLDADELAAFNRCVDCFDDGEGYDVPKPMMSRLASIGVLRHVGKGVYETTEFGMHIRLADIAEPVIVPTVQAGDERNAALEEAAKCAIEEVKCLRINASYSEIDEYAVEIASAIRSLKSATPADKGNAPDEVTPTYTTGHCEYNKQPGGCQQHNLHCGWPKCDQKEINHA